MGSAAAAYIAIRNAHRAGTLPPGYLDMASKGVADEVAERGLQSQRPSRWNRLLSDPLFWAMLLVVLVIGFGCFLGWLIGPYD